MESQFFPLVYILGTITACAVFLWYGSRFERKSRHLRDGRLYTEKVENTGVKKRLHPEKSTPLDPQDVRTPIP
jgi:hypothetical protein